MEFEKEPRYKIMEESQSGHCCFEYTIVDTHTPHLIYDKYFSTVCETFDRDMALLIVEALNKTL